MENIDTIKQWLSTGSINIFGRPFAGKDTQGRKLTELFDAHMMGGGEILRNSDVSPRINEVLARGELIPSEDYVEIVLPYLSKPEFAGKPLILSSVGRWLGEETGVMQALKAANHDLKCVIYLDISEDEVRARWHALENHDDRHNRNDDTLEALEVRLKEYREKTLPVIEKYRELGLLIEVDGVGDVDAIHQHILVALANRV